MGHHKIISPSTRQYQSLCDYVPRVMDDTVTITLDIITNSLIIFHWTEILLHRQTITKSYMFPG